MLHWWIILIICGCWPSLLSGIDQPWSRCMILSMYCWLCFASIYFVEDFCILCSSGLLCLAYNVLFCGVLVWEEEILHLLWMFPRIHQWRHLVPGFCLLGGFGLLIQSPYWQLAYSDFSISSRFSLGRLYVSRNFSISSRLSSLLAYTCW